MYTNKRTRKHGTYLNLFDFPLQIHSGSTCSRITDLVPQRTNGFMSKHLDKGKSVYNCD